MTDSKDGGPAFPSVHQRSYEPTVGMPLRDYFAGQALAGLLSDPNINFCPHEIANISYQLADAMLAEREKERS